MDIDIKKMSFKQEFKTIIQNYINPLLGIKDDDVEETLIECKGSSNVYFSDENGNRYLYFYPHKNSLFGFRKLISKRFSDVNLPLIRKVLEELRKVMYRADSTSRTKNYINFDQCKKNYEFAVQRAIISWIFGEYNENIERLLSLLEKWSIRTHEGRKVPFAFVIDYLRQIDDGGICYIDFLEDEYSATLSDGITSIIELDLRCNYVDYHSITEGNIFRESRLNGNPYRFSQVIDQFTDKRVGIFLLTSGDIILVKDQSIKLVKREGNWLNFDKQVLFSVLEFENERFSREDKKPLVSSKLMEQIYSTALDVSFSHSGGIIAVVSDYESVTKPSKIDSIEKAKGDSQSYENETFGIIDYIDDISENNVLDFHDLAKRYPSEFDNPRMKKRFAKREIIQNLIKKYDNTFEKIDRKLRCELVSMDGATIIDSKGKIISIGAIIQNDSGSYGGGRGSAAKKLSKYGMAIKISTDGYVEIYIAERIKYIIK